MKRYMLAGLVLSLMTVVNLSSARAGFFDDLTKGLGLTVDSGSGLDDSTIVRGLKEALSTGTTRAVTSVSRRDGYFGNQMIKIMLPEKIRSTADLLGKFGFQQQVDDVILGMNRAAEKAAPRATEHFVTALRAMSFEDARGILQGDATSATAYFKSKTGSAIYESFKPVIASSMQDVGVLKSYREMVSTFESIPFAGSVVSLDLEHYVATRAVDGLFSMLGEEERKIRTDPAARGTELLKKVFGR
jgi:hypothetical protein